MKILKKIILFKMMSAAFYIQDGVAADIGVQSDGKGGILSTAELVNLLQDLILSKNPAFKEQLIVHLKKYVNDNLNNNSSETQFKKVVDKKMQKSHAHQLARSTLDFI